MAFNETKASCQHALFTICWVQTWLETHYLTHVGMRDKQLRLNESLNCLKNEAEFFVVFMRCLFTFVVNLQCLQSILLNGRACSIHFKFESNHLDQKYCVIKQCCYIDIFCFIIWFYLLLNCFIKFISADKTRSNRNL